MKISGKHMLILGGFYFILSFIFSLSENFYTSLANAIFLVLLVIMLLVLCFKKEFKFLNTLQTKYHKSSIYLEALGISQFFSLIVMGVPAFVYGYLAATAQTKGLEPPYIDLQIVSYLSYVCQFVLFSALAWATYRCFFKK